MDHQQAQQGLDPDGAAVGAAAPCPRCHEHAVSVDPIEGMMVCESCGHVVDEEQLEHHFEVMDGGRLAVGTLVAMGDDGTLAAGELAVLPWRVRGGGGSTQGEGYSRGMLQAG